MEKNVKKKSKGKAKGNAGERLVCKILTKFVSGQEKPYAFWRSANSGGLATVLGMHDDLSGDIIALRDEGKPITNNFSLEIKTFINTIKMYLWGFNYAEKNYYL